MDFRDNPGEGAESLPIYFSVLKDRLPAKFRVCKKVPAEFNFKSDLEDLWEAHEKSLKLEEELIGKIYEGEKAFENLESPEKSLLDLKVEIADRILQKCHFCEHRCEVDRTKGEKGFCRVGEVSKVSSEFVHTGEERELVPSYTIFFSGCTFECQFCQNWGISQNPESGVDMSPEELSSKISEQKERGVRNVNWVGGEPTPNLHTVLSSLNRLEVNIPSVWNSNMYLTEESMRLLSGTQDVYLTDFKYGNDECASKYSKIDDYWEVATRNHEFAREDGELIIRHLVLPNHVDCCTRKILEWVADNLGKGVRINLMNQYRPVAKAGNFPELSRRISRAEMSEAYQIADDFGLANRRR